MAVLNFPASPTVGQQYTANGSTWTWDGVSWLAYNTLSTTTVTANTTSNPTYLVFVAGSSGSQLTYVNTGLTYDAATNAITGGINGGTF